MIGAVPTTAAAISRSPQFVVTDSKDVSLGRFQVTAHPNGSSVDIAVYVNGQALKATRVPVLVRFGACSKGPVARPTCPPRRSHAFTLTRSPHEATFRLEVPAPPRGRPLEIALTHRGPWRGRPLQPGLTIARLKLADAAWRSHRGVRWGYTADTQSPFKALQVQASVVATNSTLYRELGWFVVGPTSSKLTAKTAACKPASRDLASCVDSAEQHASFGSISQAARRFQSTATRDTRFPVTTFTLASGDDPTPFISVALPGGL